ncbi:hypothetical protein F5Y18DRAFT_432176 [Xylariaceae sp. FL1019]|nr:hypothetical protein F5Y18DRAFT_432176 [Xylariaceae sp. FL1019]
MPFQATSTSWVVLLIAVSDCSVMLEELGPGAAKNGFDSISTGANAGASIGIRSTEEDANRLGGGLWTALESVEERTLEFSGIDEAVSTHVGLPKLALGFVDCGPDVCASGRA